MFKAPQLAHKSTLLSAKRRITVNIVQSPHQGGIAAIEDVSSFFGLGRFIVLSLNQLLHLLGQGRVGSVDLDLTRQIFMLLGGIFFGRALILLREHNLTVGFCEIPAQPGGIDLQPADVGHQSDGHEGAGYQLPMLQRPEAYGNGSAHQYGLTETPSMTANTKSTMTPMIANQA